MINKKLQFKVSLKIIVLELFGAEPSVKEQKINAEIKDRDK